MNLNKNIVENVHFGLPIWPYIGKKKVQYGDEEAKEAKRTFSTIILAWVHLKKILKCLRNTVKPNNTDFFDEHFWLSLYFEIFEH